MAWQLNGKDMVYVQLAKHIKKDILDEKYPPDTQIPSVRQLALEAAVNPNTMQKALTKLESEGLLYTKGTVGRFVTSDTDVLLRARMKMREEAVKELLFEIQALGISPKELIDIIQKEVTDL